MMFFVGAMLLILGMGMFQLGAEMAMTPLGEGIGVWMPKMKKLRELLDEVNPSCIIEVDGGVDAATCSLCKENGAQVLVAGSAYFKAADRAAFVKTIQQ